MFNTHDVSLISDEQNDDLRKKNDKFDKMIRLLQKLWLFIKDIYGAVLISLLSYMKFLDSSFHDKLESMQYAKIDNPVTKYI